MTSPSTDVSASSDLSQRLAQAKDRLIVALDFPSAHDSLQFLDRFPSGTGPRWVKVGLELYVGEGAPFVSRLRDEGYSIFLDLKLHDIPNTVASAVRSLGGLQVDLLTLHALGGPVMLHAAAQAAAELAKPPRLLAVTVLTSMDHAQLEAIGVSGSPAGQVARLGRLAWESGVRGLVASPQEARALRAELGGELHLVTPGIRPSNTAGTDDQKRVATPAEAIKLGASQIVVGRPITRTVDPVAAFQSILEELAAL